VTPKQRHRLAALARRDAALYRQTAAAFEASARRRRALGDADASWDDARALRNGALAREADLRAEALERG
jgi:hypothetical protein